MIKVRHLFKEIDRQVLLNDINLDVKEGEIVVVLGESGSGKSVLLRHLIGLFKPTRGTIEIKGVDITELREPELLKVRKDIGYLFQEGALYDFMTVFENISFPLREHTLLKAREIKEKVQNVIRMIQLQGAEDKYPSELSGGMRKRAALARAIILDSRILFCDEPTSGLDPIRSENISDMIYNISRKLNCTTIVTSHDIRNSFRIADRLVMIKEGEIVAEGTEKQLKAFTDPFVKQFLS